MKPIVAIFAHPDDEAFGPAGALATFVKEGRDVYLICVTDGEAGQNVSDNTNPLGAIRKEELLSSAKVLGIKNVYFLGFKDGTLSNNIYHEITDKLKEIISKIQPEVLLTLEPRGVSGHIDHVAVSLITSYLFEKLSYVQELWYFCQTEEIRAVVSEKLGDYFIYLPPGYKKEDITKTVSVSDVWEQKVTSMKQHATQLPDVEAHLKAYALLPQEENFIILKKNTE